MAPKAARRQKVGIQKSTSKAARRPKVETAQRTLKAARRQQVETNLTREYKRRAEEARAATAKIREQRARLKAETKARREARKQAELERKTALVVARKAAQSELKKAVRKLFKGDLKAAALELGLPRSTLNRWVERGPSQLGIIRLRAGLSAVEAARKQTSDDRKAFAELMQISLKSGKISRVPTRQGTRAGPRSRGYQWSKDWGPRLLDAASLQELEEWFMSHASLKRFKLWQAVVMVTTFGECQFRSGGLNIQLDHPRTDEFVIEQPISTSSNRSLRSVTAQAIGELDSILDEGCLVGLVSSTLRDYTQRSEKERAAWESLQQRRRMQKQWKKQEREKKAQEKKSPKAKASQKPISSSPFASRRVEILKPSGPNTSKR